MSATAWPDAVAAAYAAGAAASPAPVRLPLSEADGRVLAEPLVARTDLPVFPTSSVDGWAVRGDGPWRVVGRVLAGAEAPPLGAGGDCVEIATGAMVPAGTTAIVRVENSQLEPDGRVTGQPRERPEWRLPGEEASAGEQLLPAGTPVTPGLLGLAASCGYDELAVRPPPRAAVLVFGDELRSAGLPGAGRVRDALGPQLPSWLRRLGVTVDMPAAAPGEDTLDAHIEAIAGAVAKGADLVCTTGGTMRGPVDHLHPALAALDGEYLLDAVAVRPGYPMLLARVPAGDGSTLIAGLPGNPQSAVVGLMTMVVPAVAGWHGRSLPQFSVRLGAAVPARNGDTHLALVRRDPTDGLAYPLPHAGSAMLRGLAGAIGFAVVRHGAGADAGDEVPLLPLPLLPWELP